MPPQRGYLYFIDGKGTVTKAKLKRDLTVQDCPKGYVHRYDEICRKCGNKGVAVANVKVKQDPEAPVAREVLAEVIVKISDGVTKLLKSGLNRRAIVTLLRDSTGCNRSEIEAVLEGLETLARDYTR